MQGQIVKILSDTHFVNEAGIVYECKCRGIFRKNHIVPLVGDYVLFDSRQRVINQILPRKNALIRPSVANIDQAFLITSVKQPNFSTNLLDKLLLVMEYYNVEPIICYTKMDLLDIDRQEEIRVILSYYEKIGYKVLEKTETARIKALFTDKTSVFTGQTGAGKSTLLNELDANLELATGEISIALGRGRHTTRHVELIELFGGKVLDTPGFSALEFAHMKKEEIRNGFIEFKNYPCEYHDCMHLKESECHVKEAVRCGAIIESRYETYTKLVIQGR